MAAVARLTVALGLLLPMRAPAQDAGTPSTGYVFERQVRVRWLHGRQSPAFTRFDESRRWIRIDSVHAGPAGGGRTLHLSVVGGRSGDPAILTVDGSGRVTRLETRLRERRRGYRSPEDSARFARRGFLEGRPVHRLPLPETRLWELVPTFRAERLERGARWVDTLERAAERDGGFRQELGGTRVSTLLGDTIVGGRRLWIVRDSADVRYEERWLLRERTLDTLVVVERQGEGTITGRYLYDPELRLYHIRHDTMALSGTAVLRYPDGRAFSTPARYERTRRIDLHAPAGYEARRAELRAEWFAAAGAVLILPRNRLEERLAAGDTTLRDSLVAEWQRSRDPEARDRLRYALERWGGRTPAFRKRLLDLRLEAGDTARVVAEFRQVWGFRRRVDEERLRLLLPFMVDPGRAFAFGLDRDPFYENARQGLLSHPPAITADTARWPCTPEACRILARQWATAEEPRLRELAAIAHLVMDPARWADTIIARAEAGSRFVEPALQLIRGVGATWAAASKAPLPAPGAGWRAWLEWMSGRDPRYPPRRTPRDPIRFGQSHATAIRFYQARTGRDVVGELRSELDAAVSDSARLVYGAILLGLGEYRPDPATVAARFRSGTPAERALALRELHHLFRRSTPPADSATAATLMDRLLAIVIEGAEPWPELDPPPDPRRETRLGQIAGEQEAPAPVFILSDRLPAAVRERWRGRATLVTQEEVRARPDRLPSITFTPFAVLRAGPFVRLAVDYSTSQARREDQAPAGYAGGVTVYLMETGDGWVIVTAEEWIT